MVQFLQQLVNGLSLGSIYALIALGYTMVYGILKLINFAHGDVYMLGAFIGLLFAGASGQSFIPTIIISMLACALIGVLIERIAYRPLRNSSRITALITAIGVSYFIQALSQRIFGTSPKSFPNLVPSGFFNLGGVQVSYQQILIVGVNIFLILGLTYIVNKTKIGMAMRAVSQDADAARLMGIDVDKTISFTFALGSALAGAAGVLVGVYYNSINPLMGSAAGLKAFIAAVFGGIGIIPGAALGGLLIGVIETLVSGYGSSLYKDAVVYIILILILVVKPSGLLGKDKKEKV